MKNYSIILLMFLYSQLSFTQERVLSGKVTDIAGAPLPQVTIFIEETKTTSKTDFDGHYSVKVHLDSHLIFSFLGFKSQKITASSKKMNVVLEMDHCKLPEVLPYMPDSRKKKTQKIKVQ